MPKRVIICCDGTWNQPDQRAAGAPCPTNVVKFAALVPQTGADGVAQRLLYHRGIGSGGSRWQRLIDGATGHGITRSLTDCYRWLVRTYEPGDELFFFGFSRGAYTARSLAGFVRNSGILRPEHEDRLPEALALYRSRDATKSPRAAASRLFRQSYGWTQETTIRCIGVWDTVGSLGVPNTLFQGILKHVFRLNREFHDTNLSSTVEFAFHALAIDERRQPFLPTLWTQTDRGRTANQRLEQRWFAGCHSDVGGGNPSPRLADVTLAWMVSRAMDAGLAVDLPASLSPDNFPAFDPDACGPIHDSLSWFYRYFFPSGVRSIGEDQPGVTTRQKLSSEALERWACMPEWRPAALVRYLEK